MFLGQYQHTLDYKNRTSIPKKFRELLADGAVLTLGLEDCLFLYSKDEWDKLSVQMQQLPLTGSDARAFSRYLFGGAVEVSFDSLGRINIPDYLMKHAKITKKIVVVGVLNRIEIWSENNWHVYNKKVIKTSAETAEKLTGTGI